MYYVVYGLLYLLSLLPLRVLYLLSDFVYFIIYYLAGYRKKVVLHNLSIAFPEKSEKEREDIARKFYRNFTDNFIETIKLLSAGKNFIQKHFITDTGVLNDLYRQGKKCQVHLGHNFNWEIANLAVARSTPYSFLAVYMPINNKIMDRLLRKLRSKSGAILLPATEMRTAMLPWRDKQYLLALVADQNPGVPSKGYWFNFFGRPTPFVTGPEKGARANDAAVVFVHFTKRKRGYYQMFAELAVSDPLSLPEEEMTRRYIRYLERVIRESPEMWLWSHRRWKHEWKPEYGKIIA
jgi:Kdo2-lipid IVA lauroyltransferase/acyltransferase